MNTLKLIQSAINVAKQIQQATDPNSDGGADVTPLEAVKIGLSISAAYGSRDGAALSIKHADLIAAAEAAGMAVVYDG
jgi:hypothetical protein